MTRSPMTRENLLPLLAAYVLEHGLAGLSLRPLAAAVGTSDRMLLYHFASKQRLVANLLEYIAAGFTAALEGVLPKERLASRAACLEAVAQATRRAAFRPYLALWWQIVSGAAQGEATYADAAGGIIDHMLEWLEQLLPVDDPAPRAAAQHILTLIEGAQMLDAIGRSQIADGALAAAHPAP
jgi:AcrR family transcriptional regulator